MSNRTVNVGIVQLSCSNDPASNLQKTIVGVRDAAAKGAKIVWDQSENLGD